MAVSSICPAVLRVLPACVLAFALGHTMAADSPSFDTLLSQGIQLRETGNLNASI